MAEEKKGNIFKRIGRFFKDVKAELKKVTWPTKNQAVKNTAVVLVFLIVIGLFVFLIDLLFQGVFGNRLF
ncbi:MAG: preprotein translocase subunit SecE [Clostridia bacterium]|nr:preprotein translocase subunit SecE [Clostridia bacterium]